MSSCLPGDVSNEDSAPPGPAISLARYGASGSPSAYWGSSHAGSKTLTVRGLSDFEPGEGIAVYHAGTPCRLANADCAAADLPAPRVFACGSVAGTPGFPTSRSYAGTGSKERMSYAYRIAALDGRGGLTAAGAAGLIEKSVPVDSQRCNLVEWGETAGASAYAVYRSQGGGPFHLLSVTQGKPRSADAPRQRAFLDAGASPDLANPSVPPLALDSALPDHLIAKVEKASGGSVVLDRVSEQTVEKTRVAHDDTEALRTAARAAPSTVLRAPVGTYLLSGPVEIYQAITFYGNGSRTMFKRADFYAGPIFVAGEQAGSVEFDGLGYDGNNKAFQGINGAFLALNESKQIALKNLMLRNLCGPAVSGAGSQIAVSGSLVATSRCAGEDIPSLNFESGNQIKLENNRLIGPVNGGEAASLSLENNEIEGNLFIGGSSFWVWDNQISGTAVLSGSGSFGQNQIARLIVSAAGRPVSGVEIEGNAFTGSGLSGLEFWTQAEGAAISAVSILNNRWAGKPEFAVSFPPESGHVSGLSFEGNSFSFRRALYGGRLPMGSVGQLAQAR